MINKAVLVDRSIIFVPAEISSDWAKEFLDTVAELSLGGCRRVDVDLGAVLLFDSYLIGLFVQASKLLHQNGGDFFLENPNENARQVLKRNSLDRIFPVAAAESVTPEKAAALESGLSFERVDTLGIVFVAGIIDNPSHVIALHDILASRSGDLKNVIFDFSKAVFLDSLFIGELVNVHRQISGIGGSIAFAGLNEIIKDLFDRLGFGRLVQSFKDINEAKKQFEKK